MSVAPQAIAFRVDTVVGTVTQCRCYVRREDAEARYHFEIRIGADEVFLRSFNGRGDAVKIASYSPLT